MARPRVSISLRSRAIDISNSRAGRPRASWARRVSTSMQSWICPRYCDTRALSLSRSRSGADEAAFEQRGLKVLIPITTSGYQALRTTMNTHHRAEEDPCASPSRFESKLGSSSFPADPWHSFALKQVPQLFLGLFAEPWLAHRGRAFLWAARDKVWTVKANACVGHRIRHQNPVCTGKENQNAAACAFESC